MIDLAALQAAVAAATPAPWAQDFGIYQSPDDDDDLGYARGPMITRKHGEAYDVFKARIRPDAQLIALMRNALPELLSMACRTIAAESLAARRLEVLAAIREKAMLCADPCPMCGEVLCAPDCDLWAEVKP